MSWCVKFCCHEEDYTFEGETFEQIAKEVLEDIHDSTAIRYLEVSQISQESGTAFKKLLHEMDERDGAQIREQKRRKEATSKLDEELKQAIREIEKQKEFLNQKGLRNLVESKKSSLLYWSSYYHKTLKEELSAKYSALLEEAIYGKAPSGS